MLNRSDLVLIRKLINHQGNIKHEDLAKLKNKIEYIINPMEIDFFQYLKYKNLTVKIFFRSKPGEIVKKIIQFLIDKEYQLVKDQSQDQCFQYQKVLKFNDKKSFINIFSVVMINMHGGYEEAKESDFQFLIEKINKLENNNYDLNFNVEFNKNENNVTCNQFSPFKHKDYIGYKCYSCKNFINCFLCIINILDVDELRCRVMGKCNHVLDFLKLVYKAYCKQYGVVMQIPCNACFCKIKDYIRLRKKLKKWEISD